MIALRCYARQRRRVKCVARLSCGPAHSYTCQGIETRGALASARPERPCRCSDAVLGARALGRLQRTPPGSPCDSRPAAARGRGHLSLTRHRRGVYAPVSAPPRFLAQAALPWIRQLVLRRRPFPGLGRRRRSRAALFVPQGTTTGGARRSFLPPHPGPPFPRQPSPAPGAPPRVRPAGPPPASLPHAAPPFARQPLSCRRGTATGPPGRPTTRFPASRGTAVPTPTPACHGCTGRGPYGRPATVLSCLTPLCCKRHRRPRSPAFVV
jgi:hypothetical protein